MKIRVFILLWLIFFLSAFILLLNLGLNVSGVTLTENISGPFASWDANKTALIVELNKESRSHRLLNTGGDNIAHPHSSTLKAEVNGLELGPAHTLHQKLLDGSLSGAFSHWDNNLIFTLPKGIENSNRTQLVIDYPVTLSSKITGIAWFLLFGSAFFLGFFKHKSEFGWLDSFCIKWGSRFFLSSRLLLLLIATISSIYLANSIYAAFNGYALPNAAVFSYFLWLKKVALIEPDFAYYLLCYALIGFIITWAISLANETVDVSHRNEQELINLFGRVGVIIILGLYIFSVAGTWAGISRPQDLTLSAFGGMIPFNDATGHYIGSFEQAYSGNWNYFVSRRVVAAALRNVGMFFSGYSNIFFIFIQTILLAIASFIATRSVMRKHGFFAGITFLGLTMILVRPYLPTNLTEPIGILLALFSIPVFIRAFDIRDIGAKGLSLLLSCLALLVRMGNMFFIPAMLLWSTLIYRRDPVLMRRVALVMVAIAGIAFLFNLALFKFYGSEQGAVGGNFSMVFCGITHNGDWTTCEKLYGKEIASSGNFSEEYAARMYYQLGFEKFYSEPSLFFKRIWRAGSEFLGSVPGIVLDGYTRSQPSFFPATLWILVMVLGLCRLLWYGMHREEFYFWILFVISLIASASIVFFDDGIRVLCVSYPLLILLISSAFSTFPKPIETKRVVTYSSWKGWGLVSFLMLLCLVLPSLSYRTDIVKGRRLLTVSREASEDIFLASRYMTGFLILPDNEPLPRNFPAMSFSSFTRLINSSEAEHFKQLNSPLTPVPPFAIVVAPGVSTWGGMLIIPSYIFTDRDAIGWKLALSDDPWPRVLYATAITKESKEGD